MGATRDRWTELMAPDGAARRSPRPSLRALAGRAWRRWDRPVLGTLAIVALGLGWWGAARMGAGDPAFSPDGLHPLSTALKLFFLNGPSSGDLPWQLEVARLLAPAIPVYAGVAAVLAVSRERWVGIRVRGWEGHAVVVGLGDMGARLVADLRCRGRKVVVLEHDARGAAAERARSMGAVVLEGDALDPSDVGSTHPETAGLVAVFAGSDSINVAAALHVVERVRARRRGAHVVRCGVHVGDATLRRRLREATAFGDPAGAGVDLRYVGVHEAAAASACADHLAEVLGGPGTEPRHLVVVGLGQLGEALVVEAARSPASTAQPPLRITVIDQKATTKVESLKRRHVPLGGAIAPTTTASLVELHAWDHEVVDGVELARLVRALGADGGRAPDAVAICLKDERLGLATAHALGTEGRPALPVLLRLSAHGGCAQLIQRRDVASLGLAHVRPFAVLDDVCTAAWLESSPLERAAHVAYLATSRAAADRAVQAGRTPGGNPSAVAWSSLDPALQDSCRAQVLHIPWKLARVGLVAVRTSDPRPAAEIPETAIGDLAELEHARWNAERLLGGWRHTPGTKDPARRLNPSLVPWTALSQDVRAFDVDAVRAIPMILEAVGAKAVVGTPAS